MESRFRWSFVQQSASRLQHIPIVSTVMPTSFGLSYTFIPVIIMAVNNLQRRWLCKSFQSMQDSNRSVTTTYTFGPFVLYQVSYKVTQRLFGQCFVLGFGSKQVASVSGPSECILRVQIVDCCLRIELTRSQTQFLHKKIWVKQNDSVTGIVVCHLVVLFWMKCHRTYRRLDWHSPI